MTTQNRELAVETDTALAAQYDELAKAERELGWAIDRAHRSVGDKQSYQGVRRVWRLTDVDALAKAHDQADASDPDHAIHDGHPVNALRSYICAGLKVENINTRINELDRVWAEHRWNRYFLVTNTNGHVHRGMGCSTCFPTTEYVWLVELADCDEAEMIEEFGEKACTVCFPDAPANPSFHGPGRRDREAVAARQAEKDARELVKAAKRLRPEEQFRNHMGDRVTTVAAAKQALRDEIELKYYYGRGPHNWHPAAVEVARKAREVLLARGSEAAELDTIVARAEKKHARFAKAS